MLASPLSLSPTPADLKDLFVSCCEHSLHTNFRRGLEKPTTRKNGINIGLRCGGRDTMRGLHF
jgi:hypothetical protein